MKKITKYIVPRSQAWPVQFEKTRIMDHEQLMVMASDHEAAIDRITLPAEREGRVYVAGPMTGFEDLNFPAFNAAAAELRANGFHVENPAEHGVIEGAEWEDYLRFDIARLATCEAIYFLPGWSNSQGAKLEYSIARALRMRMEFHPDAEPEPITEVVAVNALTPWKQYPVGIDSEGGSLD